jgi:predicted metal-binding membrane protein
MTCTPSAERVLANVDMTGGAKILPPMNSARASGLVFLGLSALLFAGSAGLTIAWSSSMSVMGGMPMPGGWTMSMTWMPGSSRFAAAASFLAMWVAMMAATMLPSLVPMLWRYRQAIGGASEGRLGWLSLLAGLGYFIVWIAIGMAVFPLGVLLSALEMQQVALSRGVPTVVGVVLFIAGALQFSAWKAHCLACCREMPRDGRSMPADGATAWRHGLSLGRYCACCCAGPMAVLFAIGVMDLGAMAVLTAAVTLERLAPAGWRIAHANGVIAVAAGLLLTAQALGLG